MDKKTETENGTTYTASTPIESKHNTINKPYLKGHTRSSSLENNNIHLLTSTKTSLMPQNVLPGFSGTLKSRREQKRISDYLCRTQNQESTIRKLHFENIREVFEKHENRLKTKNESFTKKTVDTSKDINQNVPTRDTDVENILPDIKTTQNDIPPRITAMLSQRKNVLRPIAFKPVPYNCNSSNVIKSSPIHPNNRLNNSWSERYGSTPSLAPVAGNYQRFGSTNELNQQLGYNYSSLPRKSSTNIPFKTYDSLESILKLPDSITPTQYMSKSSHAAYQEFMNDDIIAPSPCDSNILETALRERESELAHLRQTMEHNEKVIFKVHQDKERHWELELARLKAIHEKRLKAGAQKVHKLEQLLMMQTFALRQDKKRLTEQAEYMKQQIERQRKEINSLKLAESNLKDQNNDLSEEIQMLRRVVSELKEKMEDVEWNLCQKNGEATLLRTELEDAQNEVVSKDKQILDFKYLISKLNDRRPNMLEETSESKNDISQLSRIILFKDQVIEALNNEIQKLQKDLAEFSILSDYEGIPAGHYLRHKYDSLNSTGTNSSPCTTSSPTSEKFSGISDESALCIKPTKDSNNTSHHVSNEMKRVFLYSQISSNQITIENIKNLPDLRMNHNAAIDDSIYVNSSEDDFKSLSSSQEILSQDNISLNGQSSHESEKQREEYQKLTLELQKSKESYEAEKIKWAQEKEKVLIYQRQLQKKYLEVLGKTEELEEKLKNALKNKMEKESV